MVPLAPVEKLAIGELVVGHLLIVVMIYFVYVRATFSDWKKDSFINKVMGFILALIWPLTIIYCLTPFSRKYERKDSFNDNNESIRHKSRTKKHHK